MSMNRGNSIERAINAGLQSARDKITAAEVSTSICPAMYELGATALHDPSLWVVDSRDPGDGSIKPGDLDPPLRQIGDLSDEALDNLLQAGLKVRIPR